MVRLQISSMPWALSIIGAWVMNFFRDKDTFKVDFFEDDMLQPREKL